MTRRRWVYANGEAVEVSLDYTPIPRNSDSVLWNDRIYQDDKDPRYTSRATHREFMRRNGLTTADDFTNYWKKEEQKRKEVLAGKDPTRIQHVVEAFNRHAARRR